MAKNTDIGKVQAALDRAARSATTGPKEARNGRYGDAPRGSVRSAAASALTQQSRKK
jgi:hypothetical protein